MGTKIYNSDLTNALREGARIQTSTDATPSEIAEKVVPVMEVNPRLLRLINIAGVASSGTSAATMNSIAADANNDLFITTINLCLIKDATCDAATGNFNAVVTLGGVAVGVLSIPVITLTAQSENIALSLPIPIKVDRNTTLRATVPTFTVGALRCAVSGTGYRVYNSGA